MTGGPTQDDDYPEIDGNSWDQGHHESSVTSSTCFCMCESYLVSIKSVSRDICKSTSSLFCHQKRGHCDVLEVWGAQAKFSSSFDHILLQHLHFRRLISCRICSGFIPLQICWKGLNPKFWSNPPHCTHCQVISSEKLPPPKLVCTGNSTIYDRKFEHFHSLLERKYKAAVIVGDVSKLEARILGVKYDLTLLWDLVRRYQPGFSSSCCGHSPELLSSTYMSDQVQIYYWDILGQKYILTRLSKEIRRYQPGFYSSCCGHSPELLLSTYISDQVQIYYWDILGHKYILTGLSKEIKRYQPGFPSSCCGHSPNLAEVLSSWGPPLTSLTKSRSIGIYWVRNIY